MRKSIKSKNGEWQFNWLKKDKGGTSVRRNGFAVGGEMRKEMGMKGVSFYIFAALANKHRVGDETTRNSPRPRIHASHR